MDNFWDLLKVLRKQAGMTQQQLADATGNSRQELSMMENSRFHGGFDKVDRVFRYLGYPLRPQQLSREVKNGIVPLLETIRILAVDDDPEILRGYQQTFESTQQSGISSLLELLQATSSSVESQKFTIDTVTSGEVGLKRVKEAVKQNLPYTLLFLDMRMPNGWDGLKTAREIRKVDPEIRIIIISAYRDHTLQKMREEVGSHFVFHQKPYMQDELIQLSTFMAHEWQQARELLH
ncbi:MAG: response regulator [Gammaproteobacteria bacterium]|nr:response regulator [Gammaproteobacteria bacterium]MBT3489643.1 response regulator [Gammaproteobacteria bacterium]MBT3718481.1 response regulator [Gammaproteobacteria bacterium]MBT3843920.1 response regulator [Gammaproteobacteria bacterium]MBT3893456.1 response regulator [Gammaproteobacteria bacterium]